MFESFFLAGFDGSTGYDKNRRWFDHVADTGHDRTVEDDYRELARLGIHGARETVRWPLVDLGRGRYDFSTVVPFLDAAQRHGVEVIWDLFHYGYPEGVDLLGPDFPDRFADYCDATARTIGRRTDGPCWFTPVNEPSFLAYAAGEAGLFAPWLTGRGWELKVALARAAIKGIDAIRSACPHARIVNVDPLCRVATPDDRPDLEHEVRDFNERLVFQSWDMLCGHLLPELGGSPRHLDVVGINYYWTNQWEWAAPPNADGIIPPLADDDPRRLPLTDLIRSVFERYGHEIIVSETSHIGDRRAPWIYEVARAATTLVGEGVPLKGVCLYPIQGMPEWHAPDVWPPLGLWEPADRTAPHNGRITHLPMLSALNEVRHWPLCVDHRARREQRPPERIRRRG
ncbi:MAG: glycoside hydrolase [Hyphomicrobiaceae bacterium]